MQGEPPNNISRQQTRINYDRLSGYYDWLTAGPEQDIQREGLTKLQLKEGESVLEIGCGTGRALVRMAQAVGERGRIYGLDLSPGMLQVASRRLAQAGLEQRVELTQGDAVRLPYPEAGMDAVFMSFTLELFAEEEIEKVLRECWRVLRPGGRICMVALFESQTGWVLRLYKLMHRAFPSFVDCRPIHPGEVLQKAGFAEVQADLRFMWGLPVKIALAVKHV